MYLSLFDLILYIYLYILWRITVYKCGVMARSRVNKIINLWGAATKKERVIFISHLPDEHAPARTAENEEPETSLGVPDIMTDNRGLTYVAVRNCDIERFSVK